MTALLLAVYRLLGLPDDDDLERLSAFYWPDPPTTA